MIQTDEKSGDRWLRNYPNATVFSLLGGMAVVIILAIVFFAIARPHPAEQGKPSTSSPNQPTQSAQP
ncbi:hypothetical protein [Granulicella paludicola]|uniref:hypothetical protein n=1 Tax=Granulicella paludicola TaxID=474951 RepID=UPI0021E01ED9|nr:hypothetical protein [Granulicella paludicola]